jgi:hypothetical protein
MVAPTDVSDDDKLGLPVQVGGGEALEHRNSGCAKLRRHGRIHMLVRASNVMASGLEKLRHGTHAGSANTDEMYLHVCVLSFLRGCNSAQLRRSAKAEKLRAVY